MYQNKQPITIQDACRKLNIDYSTLQKEAKTPLQLAKKEIEIFAIAIRDRPIKKCHLIPLFKKIGVDDFCCFIKIAKRRGPGFERKLRMPTEELANELADFIYKTHKDVLEKSPYIKGIKKRPKKNKIENLYLPFGGGEYVSIII